MQKPPILDRMQVLSDPIRSRLLVVLERAELTVSELCRVLQLPQSTVSRHLRVLADDGWIASRREGTNRHYSMTGEALPVEAKELWALVQGHLVSTDSTQQDNQRLDSVLRRQRSRSRQFFDRSAGEWDEVRHNLFGDRVELAALLAFIDDRWVVGDLGCGTGRATELIAAGVERVIAVDGSESMLGEAARRLEGVDNVDLRAGDLEDLPIGDGELDAALMVLVLHHLDDPSKALAEVARTLRPGGRLVILDMVPHDRLQYQQEMGHAWLGFSETDATSRLQSAGFEAVGYRTLSPDPEARGPMLFVATARIPGVHDYPQREAEAKASR
jgi:ubiquinone/menaquinone biosynthesis C-methylase UbiE